MLYYTKPEVSTPNEELLYEAIDRAMLLRRTEDPSPKLVGEVYSAIANFESQLDIEKEIT